VLDKRQEFTHLFNNIWEAAKQHDGGADRLKYLISKKVYQVNEKTSVGLNTALHFAVYYENVKAVKYLLRCKGILLNERNAEGNTPYDLVFLNPKPKT